MSRKRSLFRILLVIAFLLVNAGILAVLIKEGGWYIYEGHLEQQRIVAQTSSASAPDPIKQTIDFSAPVASGSPLVFGGAHYPPLNHGDAWNKIAAVGVTSIRVDIAIQYAFPRGTTLEKYRADTGGIRDPKNWDRAFIEERKAIFKAARARGMKVIAIMNYAPAWLTYTGTEYGVPRDWEIYRDIVGKMYAEYRDLIDYIEIWNEPNMPGDKLFLVPTGSGLTRIQAYERIFKEASDAIRAVDKTANDGIRAKIGAQVSYTSQESDFLIPLLENPETAKHIDFVSYHHYEPYPSRSDTATRKILERFSRTDIPVLQTEWSYSSKGKEVDLVIPENAGIPYAGAMLVNFLNMGLYAANYHTVTAYLPQKPFGLERSHAFYHWDGSAHLFPMAKTWRLMSKTLGLGKGPSVIFRNDSREDIPVLGFKNVDGREGVVLVNAQQEEKFVEVVFDALPAGVEWRRASVYIASAEDNGASELLRSILHRRGNAMSLKLYLPKESVTGVLLADDVSLPEQLRYHILNR
ncbi:MAG: glycoside hydrolase family 5 protein [Patescibacteria group bacterium]|nr:glycoside hydrolase family 5 protein [Patescibacteria group bacterium]